MKKFYAGKTSYVKLRTWNYSNRVYTFGTKKTFRSKVQTSLMCEQSQTTKISGYYTKKKKLGRELSVQHTSGVSHWFQKQWMTTQTLWSKCSKCKGIWELTKYCLWRANSQTGTDSRVQHLLLQVTAILLFKRKKKKKPIKNKPPPLPETFSFLWSCDFISD